MNTPEFADGPTFMRTYNEAQQARSATVITPRYSDEIIAATESGINPYVYPNVDWYDMIFRSGNYNQRANVNVSGGASRVTYYMSLQVCSMLRTIQLSIRTLTIGSTIFKITSVIS